MYQSEKNHKKIHFLFIKANNKIKYLYLFILWSIFHK